MSSATRSIVREASDEAARLARGLFAHQVEGLAFLVGRRRAILADDMGLGKTRQAIVALSHLEPDGPHLVVCPASVKLNWEREIRLVHPEAAVAIVGPEPPPASGSAGWVIVNYDILGRHAEALEALRARGFVFDEAHFIKNERSRRSRLSRRLVEAAPADAPVYLLTGTPLANRPRDLFPLLKVAGHPLGRSFLSFAKRYCAAHHNGYGWVTDGASNLEELALELKGTLLRRRKEDVLDLPEKIRTTLPVSVPEKTAGKETRRVLQLLLDAQGAQRAGRSGTGSGRSASADRGRLVAQITSLRRKLAVAKVKSTLELVEGCVEQGEKVLVFTCFTEPAEKLAEHLGKSALLLTGKTPARRRQAIVDRFQEDEGVRVLVANLIAGGVGLNLTAARQVVFNDLDWVPANHLQAEDRCHRIGQAGTVNVSYLVAGGTIDEFVHAVLQAKTALSRAVIDGEALDGIPGDALKALEQVLGQLSPKLADRSLDELGADELSSLIEELRESLPDPGARGGSGEPDAAANAEVLERALALLESSLQGAGVRRFRAASSAGGGRFYELVLTGSDLTCSCPGFEYRGRCRHARELREGLDAGNRPPKGITELREDR